MLLSGCIAVRPRGEERHIASTTIAFLRMVRQHCSRFLPVDTASVVTLFRLYTRELCTSEFLTGLPAALRHACCVLTGQRPVKHQAKVFGADLTWYPQCGLRRTHYCC
jgi:hypothetical protein